MRLHPPLLWKQRNVMETLFAVNEKRHFTDWQISWNVRLKCPIQMDSFSLAEDLHMENVVMMFRQCALAAWSKVVASFYVTNISLLLINQISIKSLLPPFAIQESAIRNGEDSKETYALPSFSQSSFSLHLTSFSSSY